MKTFRIVHGVSSSTRGVVGFDFVVRSRDSRNLGDVCSDCTTSELWRDSNRLDITTRLPSTRTCATDNTSTIKPTVMLPRSHGASTLGKTLRRPIIMCTMNSRESSAPATENMRPTASRTGDRALSSAARPTIVYPQLRTWHPKNGIVFRTISSTPRSPNFAAAAELQPDHLLHSNAEDNYVMASADLPELEAEPNVKAEAVMEEESIKNAKPTAEELHELALNDPEQNEVPETSTSYKIPEELFRAAKDAAPGSEGSYWTHAMYRSPPDAEGKVKKPIVHYCRSILTTEKVIKEHFTGEKVIGFDIEWAPNAHKLHKAKKNVSLVQIACEGRIALFHIALYPIPSNGKTSENSLVTLVAPSLKKIMEDPEVTKVGVAIKADCTRLRNYLDIHARGILELSHLHKLVKFSKSKDVELIDRRLVSLAKQVQEHLHLPLYKGDEVRMLDWSKMLDTNQVMYAASDSYAGLQLYHTLELKRLALDPVPPRPYFAETNLPIRLAEGIEIPSDVDEPKVRSEDAKVILRTKKYNKRALKEEEATEPEPVSDYEDFVPAEELSHSFFSSTNTTSLLTTSKKYEAVKKAEAAASNFIKTPTTKKKGIGKFGKLGDVSHLPLSPTHLSRRSLKTYYLWLDNPRIGLDGIGAMLRSPPTSARSVAKMVLEAIRAEGMPYEKRRLRGVLRVWRMPVGGRYMEEHPYFEMARDSGYNEEVEKEEGGGGGVRYEYYDGV
ncbi:uncharacterized protein PAC_07827 [Phialocephala subalpina]|uniref:3'-5' exonuclease domain-containing protein n=1 Tax=Phialocephala subalpina TaxID=576137 RepID=A0A1L7WYT3_9HELO|nr:uncharacterized protein PAC_07827 [Phialocephala subalpina]